MNELTQDQDLSIDHRTRGPYRHEAFLYSSDKEFVDSCASFVRGAKRAKEPVMVAVVQPKIDMLRAELGSDADSVTFVNMEEMGHNPARIIPAWRRFIEPNARDGKSVWGIGEPIWASRSKKEIVECQLHEALLNIAFSPPPSMTLMCPYDTKALPTDVLTEARRSHPFIYENGTYEKSAWYDEIQAESALDLPLDGPDVVPEAIAFNQLSFDVIRELVAAHAFACGLSLQRRDDLVLAVNELATNAIKYGQGHSTLRLWEDTRHVVCEVVSTGHIRDPLVGRVLPSHDKVGGRGLWIANQVCDLVQVRSSERGTVVRLHMAR